MKFTLIELCHAPALKIIVGLWQTNGDTQQAHTRLLETGIDRSVKTLGEATKHLAHAVASAHLLAASTARNSGSAHEPQEAVERRAAAVLDVGG